MSEAYVKNKIDEIFQSNSYDYPLNVAQAAAWIAINQKAINVKILDISEMTAVASHFLILSVSNNVQARAIGSEIAHHLKRHNARMKSQEGDNHSEWLLLDFGDLMIHIFLDHARDSFDLEGRWKDADRIEIPKEYYFSASTDDDSDKETKPTRNQDYF